MAGMYLDTHTHTPGMHHPAHVSAKHFARGEEPLSRSELGRHSNTGSVDGRTCCFWQMLHTDEDVWSYGRGHVSLTLRKRLRTRHALEGWASRAATPAGAHRQQSSHRVAAPVHW